MTHTVYMLFNAATRERLYIGVTQGKLPARLAAHISQATALVNSGKCSGHMPSDGKNNFLARASQGLEQVGIRAIVECDDRERAELIEGAMIEVLCPAFNTAHILYGQSPTRRVAKRPVPTTPTNDRGYLSRDEMLAFFRANVDGVSAKVKSKKARTLTEKHGLLQYPDPADGRAVLYSRKECERVWEAIKPLPSIAA